MPEQPTPLRVAIVPGVNPGKWTAAWVERRRTPIEVTPIEEAEQRSVLVNGGADVAFVRLPIDRNDLSVIPLYEEVTVVVVSSEHPISLFDAVTTSDLAGETIRSEPLADAIDLVVAGVGILVVPYSLARQHARRDLAVRPITDAPATGIAIAWLADSTTDDIEEFVGIVRGRTAASSRGTAPAPKAAQKAAQKAAPKDRRQPGKNGPRKNGPKTNGPKTNGRPR
jgi:DNA-binding transcriptional LysR family regulator